MSDYRDVQLLDSADVVFQTLGNMYGSNGAAGGGNGNLGNTYGSNGAHNMSHDCSSILSPRALFHSQSLNLQNSLNMSRMSQQQHQNQSSLKKDFAPEQKGNMKGRGRAASADSYQDWGDGAQELSLADAAADEKLRSMTLDEVA